MAVEQQGPRIEGARLVAGVGEAGTGAVYDAKFLISVLLVYVAKGDGEIGDAETGRMVDLIRARFGGSGGEAMGLLTEAVRTFGDGRNLVNELRAISQGLSAAECSEIFDMLLEVVMADGELAGGEIRTVEMAGRILGLDQDQIQAGIRSIS